MISKSVRVGRMLQRAQRGLLVVEGTEEYAILKRLTARFLEEDPDAVHLAEHVIREIP